MKDKYDISILVPGMAFEGDTLDKKSLGGSETAGLCLARELARIGHRVKMFSNCEKKDTTIQYDGVQYYNLDQWTLYVSTTPHDICIVQRSPDSFQNRIAAKINMLWSHDMAMGRMANQLRGTMWNIDKVIVLSKYMKDLYKEVYGLTDKELFQTRNGIDLWRFPRVENYQKNRKRLVYSARPERGLDVLIDRILPPLFEADPEIEVALFGYDNPVEHLKEFYNGLAQKLEAFGDRVKFVGQLSKSDLYKEYCQSGIYVYPTPSPMMENFCEISCISIMEAMAVGMPVVSSARGAIPETLAKNAGILIPGDAMSDEYRDKFVSAVLSYMNDDLLYAKASAAGQKRAATLGWDKVAEDFTAQFDTLFSEFNDDPVRLAHHFYRRSDIYAARAALKDVNTPAARHLRKKIKKEYHFARSSKALREHYIAYGKETDARLSKLPLDVHNFEETNESRFQVIENCLISHPEVKNILDFGCGHGWASIYLHNKVGRKWTGIDIDPGAVKWSKKYAEAHAKTPTDLAFFTGNEDMDLGEGQFDCVIVSEVLEHCVDPVSTMNKIEKWVKKDGIVIITVPYGPSEYASPNWEGFRGHLWEIDLHDIDDMFGGKKSLIVNDAAIYTNPKTGDIIGYHFICYKVDGTPVRPIDMSRKLRLQRPRQTISVSMIAGPNSEDTLRWCLNSVKWIADEIVIADCGLSDDALYIARSFGARLIKGSSPIENGFETPRNESLRACGMDWVLWIDTDEKLLGVENVSKYTRQSMWNGLSIRQHHFAIDTSFNADLPVRMFRTAPCNGKKMRFYGQVHEHPELELNKGPGEIIILPDVHIAHVGYLNESTRRDRFARNFPLLQKDMKKYPDRLLQKHFIMRDNMLLCMYELQQNGGQVTDQMRVRARETEKLYRKYFLGKMAYANIDSLEYYSQALRILGKGIEVSFSLAAHRDGLGDPLNPQGVPVDGGLNSARFIDGEEAKQELVYRLGQKIDPLTKEKW